jgi:hypothetical protein
MMPDKKAPGLVNSSPSGVFSYSSSVGHSVFDAANFNPATADCERFRHNDFLF